jgi:hypothetical protein
MDEMNRAVGAGEADPYVYFAFTDEDYLNMAKWLQDLLRYTEQTSTLLDYYRKDLNPEETGE